MTPFTLVGMPGTGKSTVSKALGEKYGMSVVSTDAVIFKEARRDPGHPVTAKFIEGFAAAYGAPLEDPALLMDMPAFVAKHGETAFRDLEEQAVCAAFAEGKMDGAIPDLSGSGFMRPAIRAALKERGVISVYLEMSDEAVLRNLKKDYEESVRTGVIKRSGYFGIGKKAEEEGQDPIAALDAYSRNERGRRAPHYEQADMIIRVRDDESVESVTERVEIALIALEKAAA